MLLAAFTQFKHSLLKSTIPFVIKNVYLFGNFIHCFNVYTCKSIALSKNKTVLSSLLLFITDICLLLFYLRHSGRRLLDVRLNTEAEAHAKSATSAVGVSRTIRIDITEGGSATRIRRALPPNAGRTRISLFLNST